MAQIDLLMPKMGESIMEATILKWIKKPGDSIAQDEAVLEIATDKVDSEVPSPVAGTLISVFFNEGDVVAVGGVLAKIETEVGANIKPSPAVSTSDKAEIIQTSENQIPYFPEQTKVNPQPNTATRFYSPLVLNIAASEQVSMQELSNIEGSGAEGRVTKKDILAFIEKRSQKQTEQTAAVSIAVSAPVVTQQPVAISKSDSPKPSISLSGNVEIIEMDRMRKMIAENMVKAKQIAPHVTSFIEADVTPIVQWRDKVKKGFEQREGEKLTFTPIFIWAIVKAIKDFPMINISVDGTQIIRKKDINIGMAAALPNGNLIVPVIKNADQLNLVGLTKKVNELAFKARNNKLSPDEIQGATYTITNVGTFGNVMGTPIIPQPQVAIMATGAIRKKPAVLELPSGDVIAIRQMMFLSHSYDHRVVDGALGGSFLRKVADYLEAWDVNQTI